mgnify:CR=1 FL=1
MAARGPADPEALDALATLCREYWYPIYALIRRGGHALAARPHGRHLHVQRDRGRRVLGGGIRVREGTADRALVADLAVTDVEVAPDRRSLRLRIPGLKAGYVVYLRLADRLRSASGNTLWTAEAWYTLNAIPGGAPAAMQAQASR